MSHDTAHDTAHKSDLELELLRLVRGEGALRLALGEGIFALETHGGWMALGYPTLDAYARERLGRSGRWISDARALTRKLAQTPDFRPLREALMSGRLSVSKVEVVLKLLSGLTEQPVVQVIEAGRYLTVKQLRKLVGLLDGRSCRTGQGDESIPRAWVTLTRKVDPVDLMAFEYVLKLISGVSNLPDGDTSRAQAVEYVLAEAMTTLMRFSKLDLPSLAPAPEDMVSSPGGATEGSASAPGFRPASKPDPAPELETDIVWPEALEDIDAQLVSLSQTLARRDLDIGVLGRQCCAARVHVESGYDNFDDYCREVLQFSPTAIASRMALANRLWRKGPIESALVEGRIGFEAASLLARVSQKADAEEWVERATRLTVKQLREEVETAKLFQRVSDEPARPPSRRQMRESEDFERAVYSTLIGRMEPEESRISGEVDASEHAVNEDVAPPRAALRLSLPVDLATFWRELEAEHRDHVGGDFVPFLVQAVLGHWRGAFSELSKIEYSDVYQRDRWKCQNPRCTSRHVTPHHIVFRSAGGGEERSNLLSLCVICHLDLVHGRTRRGATLRVSGFAPDELSWSMG